MDWIRDLTIENFLAVYDVALDIHADLQLGQKPRIPMVPSIVRFPLLMPMDGATMRDRYGNLRWKAMEFLKGKKIIQKIDLLKGGHRWETQAELQVDAQLFREIFPALEAEYHQRTQREEPAPERRPEDLHVEDVTLALPDFEKVTVHWLVNHLPVRYWIYAFGFLIAIFVAGIQVGQLGFVREIIGKHQQGRNLTQKEETAYRMELIKQWRNGIESIEDSEWRGMGISFGDKPWYSSLRQYMKKEAIEKLERPRTLIVPSQGRGGFPMKQILLDEVARIEKEWGLTGCP